MVNILTVDDRAVNRECLSALLAPYDYRITEAASGAQALDRVRNSAPDLIITDVLMPGMDGFEFCQRLMEDATLARIPILFYTAAFDLDEVQKLADQHGNARVLSKPSDPQTIRAQVAQLLNVKEDPASLLPVPGNSRCPASCMEHANSLRIASLLELSLALATERRSDRMLALACRGARNILDAPYVALALLDETGCLRHLEITGLSDAVLATLGSRPSDASFLSAFHPPTGSVLIEAIQTPRHHYGWLYAADSSDVPAQAARAQLAVHLAAQVAQTWENLQAQQLIADRERRLHDMIESTRDAIITVNDEKRIELFNAAAETMFGYPREEILGQSLDRLILGKLQEPGGGQTTPFSLACMTDEAHATVSLLGERTGSINFLIEASTSKALGESASSHTLILRDVTERQREADLLQQAKLEAEAANNAKSRFLAAASHDLRQPLSALSLYTGLLKNTPGASERKVVANMQVCIDSLSELLNDLLDLSKLDAGVVTPCVSDFAIATLFDSLVSVHAPQATAHGLRLRCVPSILIARTDPLLLQRCLGNFMANALRYTERGGVLVACRQRQGKTWIEVWDTGVGVPADKTGEIFEEFMQLGDGARNHGSGLGLAIVAKTATLLGLAISVRSRLGRGSVFAIELPLGAPALAKSAAAPHAPVLRPLRIALLDDNAIVREALLYVLQCLGHEVVAAATMAELLAELDHLQPDIVLSDYRLTGGETGFDAITAVRERLGAEFPAILITGDTDPKLLRRMAEYDIVVLHKSLDLKILEATLQQLTCAATAG